MRELRMGLDAADFLLGPEAFVRRCMVAHGLDAADPPEAVLADAMRGGASRTRIAAAVAERAGGARALPSASAILQPPAAFAAQDVLIRCHPGDDAAFLRLAAARLVERTPPPEQAQAWLSDLRRGAIDRAGILRALVQSRLREGRDGGCDSVIDPDRAGNAARAAFPGSLRDAQNRLCLIACRRTSDGGWIAADSMWQQDCPARDGVWQVQPGLVIDGPRRTLPPGEWRLDIDLDQPADARVVIEVLANAGLDVLTRLVLSGPCRAAPLLRIEPGHLFLELRLRKPGQPADLCALALRELSLTLLRPAA